MVGKLYIGTRKTYMLFILLVITITILAQPIVVAEKPSWAQPGTWFRYEGEFSFQYGNYTINVKLVTKTTLQEVNDDYGVFKPELESLEVRVNPPNDDVRKYFEDYFRNNIQQTTTIYWDDCTTDYCSPKQLPSNGVLEKADGKYVYDTQTGMLKEYNGNPGAGITGKIRLLESSLGGGFGGLGGGGGLPWWVLIIIVIVVLVVVIGVIVMVKLRRSRPVTTLPPPPPPPPPST